ncbi:ComEC/Rec2 family competence protein [Thioclava sp. F36-6]|uniref:ComEC/Rec2 family competence protein n=1 Tax=Thioclava sp. F36-6 TaxID=1915316 RepID=UPI000997AF8F|nr:ComEC/Rec2 family competence protein [Thioclava sp. F36-6]
MAINAEPGDWAQAEGATGAGRAPRLIAALFGGLSDPLGALARARAQLFLWMPVALGVGVGAYFSLGVEPGWSIYLTALTICAVSLTLWLRGAAWFRLPAALIALSALGLMLAGLRAHLVAAPVLQYRYYGPVSGRIVKIDRARSDLIRLTLDRVRIDRIPPAKTPARVRVTLHGDQSQFSPEPGTQVMLTANLSPPPPPAAPQDYDFRRTAWFDRLGAIGYTRAPVMRVAPPDPGDWAMAAHRARMRLSAAIQSRIAGQPGAVAAALMTGDRSGLSEATREVMRRSSLAHLIAISGLHMGMLAGFVFGLVRYGLALAGRPALIWPTKKLAAIAALIAASAYLWLAGPAVSTQRAWIMVSIMLLAVLFDRRALSLRTVALAATLLMIWQPESLTEPGFQMSFAATTALIVALGPWTRAARHLPRLLRPVLMLVATSLIAGAATAPIVAAQFHRLSEYGVLANLFAVPAMGLVIMPMGVLAALLVPLGLSGPALWAMGQGTAWILRVAEGVSGLDGSVLAIVQPGPWVIPLIALGALGAILTRGAGRSASIGLILLCGALWLRAGAERPALLIAPEAQQVGLMTSQGRALSKPGAGFISERWLAADGDPASLEEAAARSAFSGPRGARIAQFRRAPLAHLTGKSAKEALPAICAKGGIVVISSKIEAPTGPCDLWDAARLREAGAVGFSATGEVTTTAQIKGRRLWTRP